MSVLSQALKSRGLSWRDTAARAGVTESRLKELANGERASLREMRNIASALSIPVVALLPAESLPTSSVLFRRNNASRVLTTAELTIAQQVDDLLPLVRNKEPNRTLTQLRELGNLDPEQLAAHVRRALGYDNEEPSLDLASRMSEAFNIAVCYARDSRIEGASVIARGYPFAFIGARKFKPRSLFTLAHELGHLIAHHAEVGNNPIVDEGDIGRINEPADPIEAYADKFASSLLMPGLGTVKAIISIREHFNQSTAQLSDIHLLFAARFFGVSFEVAARRCEALDLIPRGAALGLYQVICDSYQSPEQRADEALVPSRPAIDIQTSNWLIRSAQQLVANGDLSLGRAAEVLNIRKNQLRKPALSH